jgi:5-methylcytosine-specific restriction endonuclease McrA
MSLPLISLFFAMAITPADVAAFQATYPTEGDACDELQRSVQGLHALEVPLGRLLARWVRAGKQYEDLVASTSWLGHQHGLGPREIHQLIALGFLIEEHPEVLEPFLEARLSLENASLLHDVYAIKSAVREGEDWLAWAIEIPTADFRKKVEKRVMEVAEHGPVDHVSLWVSRETRRRFDRAREIASRKAGRMLTRSETFGLLVDDYLRRNDPLFKEPRPKARRARASDYVPESVKWDVRRRFGDRCAVSGCQNTTFLEIAHIVPRALGGSNTIENLLELCRPHHEPFDAKKMFLVGRDTARPYFVDRTGKWIGWLRTALDPGAVE